MGKHVESPLLLWTLETTASCTVSPPVGTARDIRRKLDPPHESLSDHGGDRPLDPANPLGKTAHCALWLSDSKIMGILRRLLQREFAIGSLMGRCVLEDPMQRITVVLSAELGY